MFLPSRSSHQASFSLLKNQLQPIHDVVLVYGQSALIPTSGEGCVFSDGRVHLILPAFIPDTRVQVCVSGNALRLEVVLVKAV